MKKFYIAVEEIRSTVVEVEAENYEQALAKVEKAYSEDEISLNDTNYIDDGTCFYDETDQWKPCIDEGYEVHFQKIDEQKTKVEEKVIINHGKVKKIFKGCNFNCGYYAFVDNNGQFVIGEERGREGGEIYRGEYKGKNTPYMYEIKEENNELYNSIVRHFNT